MKDSEFTELLNLYLDHEISAKDAARLEAEVLGNPARRHIYQEYCRMQKACKLLACEFQTEGVPAMAGNVVAFEPAAAARRWGTALYTAGAMAAACVALVFVTMKHGAGKSSDLTVQPQAAREDQVVIAPAPNQGVRVIPRTVTVPANPNAFQANLVGALSLSADSTPKSNLMLMGAGQPESQFDWLRNVRLAPIQRVSIEEFRFSKRPGIRTENRNLPLRETAGEMNAIQFQH